LGGPFRYVDTQGPGRILERLEHYHERFGKRFTPAPLFHEYVKAGKRFHGA
jgi:3-hydroxyacyl-CoA dehydrogenase/enoyl-CoA hydratase/3-hydroxybutyryl-CoA epimerase